MVLERKLMYLDKTKLFLICALVFLMATLPAFLAVTKIIIVSLIFILSLLTVFLKKAYKIDDIKGYLSASPLLCIGVIWLFYALYTSIVGLINNNPGIIDYIKTNLFYFLIFFVIAFSLRNLNAGTAIVKTIYWINIFIFCFTLGIILQDKFNIEIINFKQIDPYAIVNYYYGFIRCFNSNTAYLMFTFPFMCMVFISPTDKLPYKRIFIFLNLILCVFTILVSGTRIAWIALFISLIAMFVFLKCKLKYKIYLLFMFLGILSLILLIINFINPVSFQKMFDYLLKAFSFDIAYGDVAGENLRLQQMDYLVNEFLKRPIFGYGGGAVIDGYNRTDSFPWIFEASYHVVLFNSGLLGSALYILFYFFLYRCILKSDSKYKYSLIVGLSCILLANATNPYVASAFDRWFYLFVPFIYVNNLNIKESIEENVADLTFFDKKFVKIFN